MWVGKQLLEKADSETQGLTAQTFFFKHILLRIKQNIRECNVLTFQGLAGVAWHWLPFLEKKISKISSPYGTSPKACLVLESIMERRKVKIKLLKCKGFQQVAAWAEGCCTREGQPTLPTVCQTVSLSPFLEPPARETRMRTTPEAWTVWVWASVEWLHRRWCSSISVNSAWITSLPASQDCC